MGAPFSGGGNGELTEDASVDFLMFNMLVLTSEFTPGNLRWARASAPDLDLTSPISGNLQPSVLSRRSIASWGPHPSSSCPICLPRPG